jgi:hypothetical protein
MSNQQQHVTSREGSHHERSREPTDDAIINDPLIRGYADGIELREGYADVGDVKLHYVEAGDGPLIVLLHGFPEFWFDWRLQIAPLVAAGFRVVAPDTRGYNLSSKPEGYEAYAVDLLAADIRDLIEERGAKSALLVGHDWGGSIAWTIAMNHPDVVDRLAILNAAHPRRLSEGLHHRASSGSPGTSSSSSRHRDCQKTWCTPETGTSSDTSCMTRTRPTPRRKSTATSRRGHSQAPQPG